MVPFDDSPLEQRLAGTDRILHLACQFQAPLRIVQLLSDRHPMSIRTLDDDGRYPLHIACARGAKPKVINYMLDACNMAVRWQDKTGSKSTLLIHSSFHRDLTRLRQNCHCIIWERAGEKDTRPLGTLALSQKQRACFLWRQCYSLSIPKVQSLRTTKKQTV